MKAAQDLIARLAKEMAQTIASSKQLEEAFADAKRTAIGLTKQHHELLDKQQDLSLPLVHTSPELFPELPATVRGFKDTIDALPWIVTKAAHRLADKFTTKLELEVKAATEAVILLQLRDVRFGREENAQYIQYQLPA